MDNPLPPRGGRLTIIFLGVVAIGLLAGLVFRSQAREPALVLELTLFDGSHFVLAEQHQPAIVNFWASWCAPCRREIPRLIAFSRQHPELLVVGVATDDRLEAAQAFATEMGIDYPAGFDQTGAIADAFGVPGLPVTVAIDLDGRVVRKAFGEVSDADLESLAAALGS